LSWADLENIGKGGRSHGIREGEERGSKKTIQWVNLGASRGKIQKMNKKATSQVTANLPPQGGKKLDQGALIWVKIERKKDSWGGGGTRTFKFQNIKRTAADILEILKTGTPAGGTGGNFSGVTE